MRNQNDDQLSSTQLLQTTQDYPKKSRIRYTREFLLSLSELEICRKLPSGFDPSILSEFEDVSNSIPERPRIPGSLSSQNFKRGEYGSSPPTRGDYSRGVHGRWDTRSSGSNDKDSDSQFDSESDSGRRYGNQSRRSWQNSEHDGLLGSGSFPKASGFAGASVTKARGSGQYPLSKSNEPYQPPRPYKAAPLSRRDATDMINEETFGSSESSSQDRAEEERKRRASFEQFRKEQKTIQEKQKQFPDKRKENADPDIAALLANCEDDKKLWDKNIRLEDMTPNVSQRDSLKSSAAQSSAPRPLVPPGFTGVTLEKNLEAQSLLPHSTLEVGNSRVDDNTAHVESRIFENGTSNTLVDEKLTSQADISEKIKTVHAPFPEIREKSVIFPSDGALYEDSVGVVTPSYKNPMLSELYGGNQHQEVRDFYTEKVPGDETVSVANQEQSTSILAKLFGKASIVDSGVPSFSEPGDDNAGGGNPLPFQSKFTHWFIDEEKRPEDDLSSSKPEDLLSLIVNGEKDGSQPLKVLDKKPSIFTTGSSELKSVNTTSCPIATIEPPYRSTNAGSSQGVLTCEDLEQSILSEFSDNSSNLDHSFRSWSVLDGKAEKRPEVDNQASQHLLSLLQRGASTTDFEQSPIHENSENLLIYEGVSINSAHNTSVGDAATGTTSEKNLTLETLFGKAFMKELQSDKAPVSVQRGSVGGVTESSTPPDSQGFPFPISNDSFTRAANKPTFEGDIVSNHIQQSKSSKSEETWLGFDSSQSKLGSNHNVVSVIDRPNDDLEVKLPDEDSLISAPDPVIPPPMTIPVGNANNTDMLPSSSVQADIVDKLAAFNAVLKMGRSTVSGFDDPHFVHGGTRNPIEADLSYQNQHERPASQFGHLQMNHGRPMFQSSDSYSSRMNPPFTVMGPENVMHPELAQHNFPANVVHSSSFQHASNEPTRFSPPAHHPMLQQMHMQGNMLPPHLLRGLPRGVPVPPYATNQMSGYAPELSPMHSLPFSHHQPNYAGVDMPMQAHAVRNGGNIHPEIMEKLREMELRRHVAGAAAHNLGGHGHGLDMGFRYR